MTVTEYKQLTGKSPTLRHRLSMAKTYALRWLWRTPFGWLMWNPVFKYHSVSISLFSGPVKNPAPFLNGKPAPHPARAIVSVFGWGWLDGYLSEPCESSPGGRRYVLTKGRRGSVVRKWMFGRVELREGKD